MDRRVSSCRRFEFGECVVVLFGSVVGFDPLLEAVDGGVQVRRVVAGTRRVPAPPGGVVLGFEAVLEEVEFGAAIRRAAA